MKKNTFLIISISVLLLTGLYINFILQKDFLTQIGFEGFLAIICILFFDSSKIISEILFFRMKNFMSRFIVGIFAILLIFLSIYTTFSVRTWKSQQTFKTTENRNMSFKERNKQIEESKQRLTNQLTSLEEQIKMKRDLVHEMNNKNQNKWITFRYNKEINTLNEQKLLLLKKIENLNTEVVFSTKETTTLPQAMIDKLGGKGEELELLINLIIASVTDGIILFLCFGLSFVISQKENQFISFKSPRQDIDNEKHNEANHYIPSNNITNFNVSNKENILFYDDPSQELKKDFTISKKNNN